MFHNSFRNGCPDGALLSGSKRVSQSVSLRQIFQIRALPARLACRDARDLRVEALDLWVWRQGAVTRQT